MERELEKRLDSQENMNVKLLKDKESVIRDLIEENSRLKIFNNNIENKLKEQQSE
jgi:hypothetical protein